jgi:hypothetical protein
MAGNTDFYLRQWNLCFVNGRLGHVGDRLALLGKRYRRVLRFVIGRVVGGPHSQLPLRAGSHSVGGQRQ